MSRTNLRKEPGQATPLGATWDGKGTNFAIFSGSAERIELCLFDAKGGRELHRVALDGPTDQVWHAYLPDVEPGQLYGYRVYGPYEPLKGLRFNHHKLLLDPYAKAIQGQIRWTDSHYAYRIGHPDGDLSFDDRDDARHMPKCQVVDGKFGWNGGKPPRVPWTDTIVYETHVRSFTERHPDVPEGERGTFAGLAAPACIRYLRELGVTSLELLPIHAFVRDHDFVKRGLTNYWGYNSIGFFAPDNAYLGSGRIDEMKAFVRDLHEAGIEVILDVVYNHTGEGNQMGPTLSFRGIDNAAYYRLDPKEPRLYENQTGCGNSFNLAHPRCLALVLDSLRYWVTEFQIDGFRFDLAATLIRDADGTADAKSAFLKAVRKDPLFAKVKMIAEPWDVGLGGYQLGAFGRGWSEWNDRYRDAVRQFWKGDGGKQAELATRLTGSSDIFAPNRRSPTASVNFVTAHDGFTLADLVSYNAKHNEANQEGNRDGTDNNNSWNCGVEGPTEDPEIKALRLRQRRNMFATLMLSLGVPMINGGDEFGRSQNGNNNAYCHDDPISWYDWEGIDDDGRAFQDFCRRMIQLRKDHPVSHRNRYFRGETPAAAPVPTLPGCDPTAARSPRRTGRPPSPNVFASR
jgi:isoamylase